MEKVELIVVEKEKQWKSCKEHYQNWKEAWCVWNQ